MTSNRNETNSRVIARSTTKQSGLIALAWLVIACVAGVVVADDSLERRASWQVHDAESMTGILRSGMDALGVTPAEMDAIAEKFQAAIEEQDQDALDAYVSGIRGVCDPVEDLLKNAETNVTKAGIQIDPNGPQYAAMESLPDSIRASVRTWLGRELVRQRLYDEALPVIAEVDAVNSIDPAATLFFRGSCYHTLLMKKEALVDLRRLLENEDDCPVRFSRTAKMMVADIKPLKEDSLDEISRLMTDVGRRLDLGRTDQDVQDREQKIIDKLTKLIEKIEEQQQQQQQQQQQSSGGGQGNPQNQNSSPMQDSQASGANGAGDVDRRDQSERGNWGDLPPAERQQALQQISQDLPSHYREAIEAYFRKIATDN